jgi:hypothetical protein
LHARRTAGKPGQKSAWPDDRAVDLLTRAPVEPMKIGDAQSLNQVRIFFLPSLVPQSAAAAILAQGFQFSFDGAASISAPSVTLPTPHSSAKAPRSRSCEAPQPATCP